MKELNKRKFDLFVSDFDGTLGRAPDYISEANVKAIKEFVAQGGIFAICTGRMFASIRPICLKYGLKGLVISYQGTMINDIETGECLCKGGMDSQTAAEVARFLISKNIALIADVDDVMYVQGRDDYINHYEKACSVNGIDKPDLSEFILQNDLSVLKLIGVSSPENIKQITEETNRKFSDKTVANSGAAMLVEVVNKKFTKHFAVEFLSKHYGIPYDRIITVGDFTNDIGLIEGPWHGVAVGNAVDELKAVAKEVTIHFDQDPVKLLLEKYCLQKN